jgi:predicted GIY-YIG superfamily endonuclease
MWFCYLIESEEGHTYNGATTNPCRRIRQHNREIKGGAYRTKKGTNWTYRAIVAGFPSEVDCLQCEWRIKYPYGKRRTVKKPRKMRDRIKALAHVFSLPKWTVAALPRQAVLSGWVHEDYWFDWEESAFEHDPQVNMTTGPVIEFLAHFSGQTGQSCFFLSRSADLQTHSANVPKW